MSRPIYRKAIQLGAGAIHIAGVEEQHEPLVGPIQRAADKMGDLRRAKKAMLGHGADDREVAVRQAECGWLLCPTEPGSAPPYIGRLSVHPSIPAFGRSG
jgi:hypothetical protein